MIKKILSLVDQKLLRFIIVGCINTVVGTAIMLVGKVRVQEP